MSGIDSSRSKIGEGSISIDLQQLMKSGLGPYYKNIEPVFS